jgi:translation initiation factor 1A
MTRNEKQKRMEKKSTTGKISKVLLTKEEGQFYARITKNLGGGYMDAVVLPSGDMKSSGDTPSNIRCRIRGSFRNRVWISAGDVVLVSERDFDDTFYDIIHKYTLEESRKLVRDGHVIFNVSNDDENDGDGDDVDNNNGEAANDDAFDFDDI